MKRFILLFYILIVVMSSLAIPYVAHADCKDVQIDCAIVDSGGEEKVLATTTFSMCWSWSHAQCRPCHGGGEWSYFASWCDGAYGGCNNGCWGCYTGTNECYDGEGHRHYY